MIEREVSYALLPSQGQDLTKSVTSDDALSQWYWLVYIQLCKRISHCTTNIYIWQCHVYSRHSYVLFIIMNSCSYLFIFIILTG